MNKALTAGSLCFASLLSGWTSFAEPSRESRYELEFFAPRDETADLPFCVLLPYARCERALEVGIGFGGGAASGLKLEWEEPNTYVQVMVDGGVLFRVLDWPSIQLGPMIGFDAEIFDQTRRFHFYAAARGRLWMGRWVTLDASLGVTGSFDGGFRYQGIGGIGELALTLHGHLGAYVQTQVVEVQGNVETRVTGGFRGSFVAWAVVFAGMG